MSAALTMWSLDLSPNNKKVRLALGYKGIDYERISVDPADRSALLEVSGQPLTPVIRHGETVVFDSHAIVRYLEANVQREPRLFSEERETMKAIETWERFARSELGAPIGAVFGQLFADEVDEAVLEKAGKDFSAALAQVDDALSKTGFLVGDRLSAADIFCGGLMGVASVHERVLKKVPIFTVFHRSLKIDAAYSAVHDWWGKLRAYDEFKLV